MFDPISAAIMAGAGLLGGILQKESADKATEAQARAAEEQMRLAQKQFESEQAEMNRQIAKEEATQANMGAALDSVFNSKKKEKKLSEQYLGDVNLQ